MEYDERPAELTERMFAEWPLWTDDESETGFVRVDEGAAGDLIVYRKARFTTASGARFSGCLRLPGANLAVLFISGESVYLNPLLPVDPHSSALLRAATGAPAEDAFPLTYEYTLGEQPIRGEFRLEMVD